MTNVDGKATAARATGRIPTASGDDLDAWLYLPAGDGPHPAVVMAHGIGAIKAGGLAPFAERFCREGFAAVVFDCWQWAARTGSPVRSCPFCASARITARSSAGRPRSPALIRRIFAWGTSFAGMYIVELAASDARLAGAVAISPGRRARHRDNGPAGESFDDVLRVEVEFLRQHAKTPTPRVRGRRSCVSTAP